MSITIKGGDGPVFRNVALADRPGFAATFASTQVVISGSSASNVVIADANHTRQTDASYHLGGYIEIDGMPEAAITNFTPEICTIEGDRTISWIKSGTANLKVTGAGLSIPLTLDLVTRFSSPAIDSYHSPLAGSLAATLISESATRLPGTATQSANGSVYATQNHATATYVRNTNLWCADIVQGLTCISPWNSRLTTQPHRIAGTLITPRHVISAEHYRMEIGNTIRFVDVNGVVYTRTIIGKATSPDYVGFPVYKPDFRIYTLNSPLPSAISPCKVVPEDFGNYLVNNHLNRPPALLLDQEEKALVGDMRYGGETFGFAYPIESTRLLFSEPLIPGDSGNPAFLIVDGEPVLLTVFTRGGPGSGTAIADYHTVLNAMIVASDEVAGVSTGHTLTSADFSAYPDYS